MDRPSSIRKVRELGDSSWPGYSHRDRSVRTEHQIATQFTRLIYFDQGRAAELLDHIASTSRGRAMLAKLAKSAELSQFDFAGNWRQHDQRAIMHELIVKAADLEAEGIIDLHQPDDALRRTSWTRLHPNEVIAIRGAVTSAKDVQLSSLRLEVEATSIRVYVERDHLLHLNQSYFTGLPITVVGKVRSVPRTEMCAAAIGILSPLGGAQQGSSTVT